MEVRNNTTQTRSYPLFKELEYGVVFRIVIDNQMSLGLYMKGFIKPESRAVGVSLSDGCINLFKDSQSVLVAHGAFVLEDPK